MTFSAVIFVGALWALSSEMIEDSFVNLILGQTYGWRTLLKALVAASAALTVSSAVLVHYALALSPQYIGLASRLSAGLLGLLGASWLLSSMLRRNREPEAVEEAKRAQRWPRRGGFLAALELESIEVAEVLLIIMPLVITSHALESISAGAVGILVSVSTAAALRKRFEAFVAGRLGQLKTVSGLLLIALSALLFTQI